MKALSELYVQQFKTTIAMMLQYRAVLVIYTIEHVLEPLVYLVVWSAAAGASGGSVGNYSARGFAAYFITMMLVNQATYTWIMYEYDYRIREGVLSFALLKPVHPIHSDIADNISAKLVTLPVILAAAAGLTLIFEPSAPLKPWALAAFVPALLLAFLLRFLVEWTLAQVAFWTMRTGAVNQMYYVLVLFLSGQIAPLELFPAPVRIAASVLPFRWMIGFPVELALGGVSPFGALAGIAVQTVWIVLSLALLKLVWRRGLRVYSAVGA